MLGKLISKVESYGQLNTGVFPVFYEGFDFSGRNINQNF